MKYKGKVVSGSSLLTILGVVCFATVVVSAVLITSNTLQFTPTPVVQGDIALTATTTPGTTVLGNNATYVFNANVKNAVTGAIIEVRVAATSMSASNITSAWITYNGTGPTSLGTFTQIGSTGVFHANYTVGAQGVYATIPVTVAIKYASASTYTVSVIMSGTA